MLPSRHSVDGPEQAPGRKRPRTGRGEAGRSRIGWDSAEPQPNTPMGLPSVGALQTRSQKSFLPLPPRLVLGSLHASRSQLSSLCTSFCKIIEAAEMSHFCGRDRLRGSAWPCPAAPWLQKGPEALYLACSEIHPAFISEGFRILSFSQCPLEQKRESQTIRAKRYLSDHL